MEFSQMFEARNLKHPAAEKVKMAFEKTYNMPLLVSEKNNEQQRKHRENIESGHKTSVFNLGFVKFINSTYRGGKKKRSYVCF